MYIYINNFTKLLAIILFDRAIKFLEILRNFFDILPFEVPTKRIVMGYIAPEGRLMLARNQPAYWLVYINMLISPVRNEWNL